MGFDRPLIVAYCRVSTLEQKRKGFGIDIQVRDVRAFAERQGLLVQRWYKDEAESGVAEDRKKLRRLLRDCRAGRVGSVILLSLDRLSRDVRIAENLFHEFATLGVDVLIADMPTYNGRDRKDVLVRQIREAIAEENRKEIIERLWKGRQERVRDEGAARIVAASSQRGNHTKRPSRPVHIRAGLCVDDAVKTVGADVMRHLGYSLVAPIGKRVLATLLVCERVLRTHLFVFWGESDLQASHPLDMFRLRMHGLRVQNAFHGAVLFNQRIVQELL